MSSKLFDTLIVFLKEFFEKVNFEKNQQTINLKHMQNLYIPAPACNWLTLRVPIMTAAEDRFCDIFPNFPKKKGMIFHENRLPADDSHEISCLICYF